MKYKFYPIENGPQPLDFVYVENYIDMVPGERMLGRVGVNQSLPKNLVLKGIANCTNWEYTQFEISLNSREGQKRHLFDFTFLHEESKEGLKVWLATWNPHD